MASAGTFAMRSVSMGPGATQFTVTPKPATSRAKVREKPSTPALDAT